VAFKATTCDYHPGIHHFKDWYHYKSVLFHITVDRGCKELPTVPYTNDDELNLKVRASRQLAGAFSPSFSLSLLAFESRYGF